MLQLLELLYINARRFSYLSTDQLLKSSLQKVAIPKNCENQLYHNSYVTHLYLWISRRTFSTLGIQGFRINNFKVNGKSYYFVLCLRYIKSRLTVFGLKTKCLQLSLELSAFVCALNNRKLLSLYQNFERWRQCKFIWVVSGVTA